MRCQSCDKNLNDWESTNKHNITNEYEDLCSKCLNEIQETTKHSELNTSSYEFEPEETKTKPSNFDYYEGDWND